jgi:hypothetical protein
MHPASTAHTTRCGAWRTSLRTCEVLRRNAGTLQRARKTPQTMMSETVIGEMSGLTSLIGASAPPSHAPPANPQKMPRACRLRRRADETGAGAAVASIVGTVARRAFNGSCPRAGDRREGRRAESRSECRLQSRGRGHVEPSGKGT